MIYFTAQYYMKCVICCAECMFLCLPPEETPMCTPTARDGYERLSFAGQTLPPGFPSPFLFPDGLSSIETLLTNIQVRDPSVRRYLAESA